FDVPLAILSTSSYREEAGTVRGDLDIAKYMTMTKGPLGGKILLVDDLADSGVTLDKVTRHLADNFDGVTEVKSAVIWVKGTSSIKPDYFLEELPHNPWIHQPFENYDGLRPHQLAAWMKKGSGQA
ncbi:MAG: phosphoribosyltransferase family protein, partial [Telluria sp.]